LAEIKMNRKTAASATMQITSNQCPLFPLSPEEMGPG
jgi:hypothetical protein